jgi:putative CocE/NonD family hydrolase
MTLGDGTRLDADVYQPEGAGPFPVLLQRQAYSRSIGCTICYAHPSWYASNGFIVVVQDVRGRGTSEGVFVPGEHEIGDGAEAVEWAAALPGSSGKVGMYGFSYQGYNQLLAAAGHCPSLTALAPAMGPWDAAKTWVFENGALRMKQALGWGIQMAAEAARRAGDEGAYGELFAANGHLQVDGPIAARPALLEKYRSYSHVMDWLDKPEDSPYWAGISPSSHADTIRARNLPMLMIGGWFDTHLTSMVEAWRALAGTEDTRSRLVIGPWLHFPWTQKTGAVDFGPEAVSDMDHQHVSFFKQHLAAESEALATGPVRLFDMGAKTWTTMTNWPSGQTVLYLGSTGQASIHSADGTLRSSPGQLADDYLVHDPWRPAPVTGGCYGVPPGPVDRSATDERGDVLTFTSEVFASPFTIAGDSRVELDVASDRTSFDISCVLSRVLPDGKTYQIASGYAHFREASHRSRIIVPLCATFATLQNGERVRLSVSAAAYPAYPVNPGTGGDPVSTPKSCAIVTTLRITHGAAGGSSLHLGQM